MIRFGAQAEVKEFVAVIFWKDGSALGIQSEGVNLLLFLVVRLRGRYIDKQAFQQCIRVPHFAQGTQSCESALDAAFAGIDDQATFFAHLQAQFAIPPVWVVYDK